MFPVTGVDGLSHVCTCVTTVRGATSSGSRSTRSGNLAAAVQTRAHRTFPASAPAPAAAAAAAAAVVTTAATAATAWCA